MRIGMGRRAASVIPVAVTLALSLASPVPARADGTVTGRCRFERIKGGPAGPLVGPEKTTSAAYQAFGAGLHAASWNPGDVPLEEGQVYYVEFSNPVGFNPYVHKYPEDAYPDGAGYQDGVLKDGGTVDVNMTILVYQGGSGGTIRASVRDLDTAAPVRGATVTVDGLGRTAVTDTGGIAVLREVPAGTWTLRASMPGYTTAAKSGVAVVVGGTAEVDFRIDRIACTLQFRNGSFESGLTGWTRYGSSKTSNPDPGAWFGGILPPDGSRFWGNEVNGQALGTGGAWQKLCAQPSHRYRATVLSNIYWIAGSPTQARSRLGIHPAGSSSPDGQTVFSEWHVQTQEATEGWEALQVEVLATGPVLTIFLDFDQEDASTPPPGNQWRISCFDAVTVEDLDAGSTPLFDRGDCSGDRAMDLADAVAFLFLLYTAGPVPGCLAACDSNDDGRLDIADAIHLLTALYRGGPQPPAPAGACGDDPTPDGLSCETSRC